MLLEKFQIVVFFLSDDISAQLYKHLLKTLCTDLTNMIINYLAVEQGLVSSPDGESGLTPEVNFWCY